MIFKPYYLDCLAHASYLLADEQTQTAVVVDPQRDIDAYLKDAAAAGVAIKHVILTHFHADFVAGHIELAAATGATIHLGARAQADYAFHPLADGDELTIGALRLVALETPGHTPEGITILVYDTAANPSQPRLALTGDTLFVGDVGRPDLMASAGMTAAELAGNMYDSVRNKLAPLPDDVEVWPAHGAGSMCGKSMSKERFSTIGAQKRTNWAFKPQSKAEFVKEATSDLPLQPSYFGYDADMNRKARPTLTAVLERELKAVPLAVVQAALSRGETVLDARDPDDFARGHLRGSINIGLGGKYASWAGVLLERDKPIWIVAAPGREREAALRLGRIGFDFVQGYLDRGPAAFAGRPEIVARFPRVTADELARDLSSKAPPHVLDVRAESEWNTKHLDGAQLIPLPDLARRANEVPRTGRVVIHCAGGYRSSIAASLLMQQGFTNVEDLIGGFGAWESRAPARS
ncbi:MAG: MBL fold metallo-hydrolase [Planctomycetes bacterium]|nr:MBL fold metallo-hydrolase [Planctomycetota bacterium]